MRPLLGPLKAYISTRGLDSAPNKADLIPTVKTSMLREILEGKFLVVDSDDGKWEELRRGKLIRAGVLTPTNAPGHVPVACPSMTDPEWKFATAQDLITHRISAVQQMYRWNKLFFDGSATGHGMIDKAMMKFSSGRVLLHFVLAAFLCCLPVCSETIYRMCLTCVSTGL